MSILGSQFVKKANLYLDIKSEDRRAKRQDKEKNSKNPPLWPVEKAIIKWAHLGHKHLGSPIKTDDLDPDDSRKKDKNKLKEFGILDKNGKIRHEYRALKTTSLTKFLESMVSKKYAKYYDASHGHNAILLTKRCMLASEMMYEAESSIMLTFFYSIYSLVANGFGFFIMILMAIWGFINILMRAYSYFSDYLDPANPTTP